MATPLNVIRTITIKGTTQGVTQTTAQLNQLAQAQQGVATQATATSNATLSVQRALERHQRSLDAAYKSTQMYNQVQRDLGRALQQGLIDQQRHNELLAAAAQKMTQTANATSQLIKGMTDAANAGKLMAQGMSVAGAAAAEAAKPRAFDRMVQGMSDATNASKLMIQGMSSVGNETNKTALATQQHANASKLSRYELINLSRQIQDVGVGLASSQSLFTIFIQQGTQIADVFAASNVTMGGFASQVKAGFVAIGGITTAAVAGLVALAGAAVLAAVQWGNAQREVQMALLGIGRASGVTVDQINKIAEATSSLTGFSRSEARQFASALAATGRIGADEIGPIVQIGKDIARIYGIDIPKAADMTAKAFANSAQGVEDLNQRLGSFDAATMRNVQNLMAQNREFEARQALLRGIAEGLKGVNETVATSEKFWTAVGNKISDAWDALGRFAARATGIGLSKSLQDQLKDVEERIQNINERMAARAPTARMDRRTGADLAAAIAEQTRLNAAIEQEAQARIAAAQALKSQKQEATVRQILPEIAERERLANQMIAANDILKQVNETGGEQSAILKRLTMSYKELADAAQIATGQSKNFMTEMQATTKQMEIQVQFMDKRSAADAAQQARLQKQLELMRQGQDETAEGRRQIELAGQLAAGGETRRLQDINKRISLTGELATAEDLLLQKENELKLAAKEGIVLDDEIAKRLKALVILRKESSDATERAAFGLTTFSQALKEAERQLDIAITKGTITVEESDQLRLQQQIKTLKEMVPAFNAVHQAAEQFTNSLVQGLIRGDSLMKALTNAAEQLSASMASSAIKNLFSGDFTTAAIQGTIAVVSGLFAKSQRDREEEEKRRERQEEVRRTAGEFIQGLQGTETTLSGEIRTARNTAIEIMREAFDVGDLETANQIFREYSEFAVRRVGEFHETWGIIRDAMASGLGTDSPIAQAHARVIEALKEVRSFVEDTRLFRDQDLGAAMEAGRTFLLGLFDLRPELSATAERMQELTGIAAGMQSALVELGMSAEEAAAAISGRMTAALDQLRTQVITDLEEQINELSGRGFINAFRDLFDTVASMRADFAALGLDASRITEFFRLSAQQIVDGAQLTGTAFQELLTLFPELTGVVHEFNAVVAFTAQEIADQAAALQDRLFAARNDLDTLAGQLAAFDRSAALERAETALENIALLEQVLAEERLNIIREFNERVLAETAAQAQALQTRLFLATTDLSTLEGALAQFDRNAALERAETALTNIPLLERVLAEERLNIIEDFNNRAIEEQKRAMEEAQNFIAGVTRRIQDYIASFLGGAGTPLTPQQRLLQAQTDFNTQLAIAASGDRDALNAITGYHSTLVDATRAFYGSAAAGQAIINQATSQLQALPGQLSPEQFIVNAIEAQTLETVTAWELMQLDLKEAVESNRPELIANALATHFNTLDTDINGLLDFTEFRTGLAGMASDAALRDMFTRLDLDNSGSIDLLELIRTATGQTEDALTLPTAPIVQSTEATEVATESSNPLLDAIRLLSIDLKANSLTQINILNQLVQIQNTLNAGFGIGGSAGSISLLEYNLQIQSATSRSANNLATQNAQRAIPNPFISSPIQAFEQGGLFRGPRSGYVAMLHDNEFVVNAAATRRNLPLLQAINDNNESMPSELRQLRAEVAMLRELMRGGLMAVVDATNNNTQRLAVPLDEVAKKTKIGAAR